jgi:S-adenosylmethionine decarboxylase
VRRWRTSFARRQFQGSRWPASDARRVAGLRALTRAQLDAFLDVAQCCVVSETHTPAFDAYVLSESSLFVYASKLIIKTCGTTALLVAMPRILALAAEVGAAPRRCRYSRSCFKYPKQQPAPHRSWEEECDFLDAHFPGAPCRTARVLGEAGKGLLWHVYCADAAPPSPRRSVAGRARIAPAPKADAPMLTLEICMTQLDPVAAGGFIFCDRAPAAATVTAATGIRDMFPKAVIDDFVFEPCGYSMNGLQGPGLATIHVTPEARCSYASVEVSGHAADSFVPGALLRKAVGVFKPGRISVAITVDAHCAGDDVAAVSAAWAKAPMPEGYARHATSRAELPGGGWVTHATYEAEQPGSEQPGTPP